MQVCELGVHIGGENKMGFFLQKKPIMDRMHRQQLKSPVIRPQDHVHRLHSWK